MAFHTFTSHAMIAENGSVGLRFLWTSHELAMHTYKYSKFYSCFEFLVEGASAISLNMDSTDLQ